tara:strand:+ start:2252 stop:2491 length:240 start_codon:yes stop_codon:yes gene_type:complete
MKQPFVKGDLVQLLALDGGVHENTLGTVTGISPKNGRLLIHWWRGVKLDRPFDVGDGVSRYAPDAFPTTRIAHAKRAEP